MTKRNNVKVSIITPVYNADAYLEGCLKSILGQTLKEIEVFVVDDGSSDNSWKIIEKYAKKDNRITAIQQENAGAAVARNRGLELAKGEYIGFVDSDDYVDSDYFEKLYHTAVQNNADIARAYVKSEIETGGNYQISHSTKGYDDYYNVSSVQKVKENKLNLTSSNWLAVYRRSLVEDNGIRFVPDIRTGQDNIFNLHISYPANKVAFVDSSNPTYYHMNRRDGSLMTGYNFTAAGLLSRMLVVQETVSFMNSVEDYDEDVYVQRVKSVFDFFHSRLVKTRVDSESRRKIADVLVPAWRNVKHKERIVKLLKHDARFIESLSSKSALNKYIARIVPLKNALSRAEMTRQAFTGKIRGNRSAYRLLRGPVHAARKANKLARKALS